MTLLFGLRLNSVRSIRTSSTCQVSSQEKRWKPTRAWMLLIVMSGIVFYTCYNHFTTRFPTERSRVLPENKCCRWYPSFHKTQVLLPGPRSNCFMQPDLLRLCLLGKDFCWKNRKGWLINIQNASSTLPFFPQIFVTWTFDTCSRTFTALYY